MYIFTFVFQSAFDLIPEAEEVHSNIDTAVNALVYHSILLDFSFLFPILTPSSPGSHQYLTVRMSWPPLLPRHLLVASLYLAYAYYPQKYTHNSHRAGKGDR